MTLKFKMKSEEEARNAKDILQSMADMLDYITLKEVFDECGMPDTSNSEIDLTKELDYRSMGWRWSDLRGQSCKVGKAKRTWYLYLCDPPLKVNSISKKQDDYIPDESVSDETLDFDILTLLTCLINSVQEMKDGRRKCMVWKKSNKKNVEIEGYPCWFHCWFTNRIVKNDGTVVDQLLAVCEYQDGHVERIKFDHIRFVEEWD